MSKIITAAMNMAGVEFLLLSIWILFAQVMVGIMLTGPNLIEEREGKTIDALLCSPLNFAQIVIGKGVVILLFSMLSQILVFLINKGFDSTILTLLLPMLIGGIVFVEIGIIIGFKISSSKNGSAVSSVIMVSLFLIVSVYKVLPDWTYKFFIAIPSIQVTEILNSVMQGNSIISLETFLLLAWMLGLGLWIGKIGKNIN